MMIVGAHNLPRSQFINIASEGVSHGSSFVAFLESTGNEDNDERAGDAIWSIKSQMSLI